MGTNSILSSAYVFSTFHYDAEVWDGMCNAPTQFWSRSTRSVVLLGMSIVKPVKFPCDMFAVRRSRTWKCEAIRWRSWSRWYIRCCRRCRYYCICSSKSVLVPASKRGSLRSGEEGDWFCLRWWCEPIVHRKAWRTGIPICLHVSKTNFISTVDVDSFFSNETLRLHPPVPTNGPRQVPTDAGGKSIAGE